MSTFWTPEKIENYKRASEYTAFHKKLSVLTEPYLDERWTLADIGCGPGLIDFWLAPMVAGIDAIDNDGTVIADLTARLDEIYLTNRKVAEKIKPRHAALKELRGEIWDVVMMSFFGLDQEVINTVLPLARRRVFIFMHGRPDQAGPLAAGDDGNKYSVAEMEAFLTDRNIAYKKSLMEMQFGQPFKTFEDIYAFIDTESNTGDDAVKRTTDIEERIIDTNRFDYPYYLPKSIGVALFIIQVGHNSTRTQ